MKIGIAQFNSRIGDFTSNTRKILNTIAEAKRQGAELVVFPELSVCGYFPRDLLDYESFVDLNLKSLHELAKSAQGISVVCGLVERNPSRTGKPLFNSAAVLQEGRVLGTYHKHLLPYYDVFDEERYFEPGDKPFVFGVGSLRMAITICEDLWNIEPHQGRTYSSQPLNELKNQNLDLILNISASPFHLGKPGGRLELFRKASSLAEAPVLFCNLVGGNDSLVFDGCSFVISKTGAILAAAPAFEENLCVFDSAELGREKSVLPPWPGTEAEWLFGGLTLGLRDYVTKCGMKDVLLGLSGGVDSSVCAAIAASALGDKRVAGVALPSRYTSSASLKDAEELAKNLGIGFRVLSIETFFELFENLWSEWFHQSASEFTLENFQPRIRMMLLMALANEHNKLVLNTSNKSEIATGYATLYGDSAGALSVLGDVTKRQVYELARFINRSRAVIPAHVLRRVPTAELRENQTDQDTLPPYDILDELVVQVIEQTRGPAELIHSGISEEWVRKFSRLYSASEHKRHQLPPVIRVSPRAFGVGRRIPIAAEAVR